MTVKRAKTFWKVRKNGIISPFKRVMSGGHRWTFVDAIWEHDVRWMERALKRDGYFVMFVPFRENPKAYFVYKRRQKGYCPGSLDSEIARGDPFGKW